MTDGTELEDLPLVTEPLQATDIIYIARSPFGQTDQHRATVQFIDNRYVQLAGDTMSGTLNMGNLDITNVGCVDFYLTPTGTPGIGQLIWNNTDGTLEVGALGGTVVLQIGQESHVRARNGSGVDITNGQAVTLIGATGQRPEIDLSDASNPPLNDSAIGLATEPIAKNTDGYVTTFGIVRGINTSAWSEGDRIFVGTTPGEITNAVPEAPTRKIFVGIVLVDNPTDGSIFVTPQTIPRLVTLSDVLVTGTTDQNMIWWSAANSRWENIPVSLGVADSGGAGFRVLRVPN